MASAPYIFNSVADMVEWIIQNKYRVADTMHFLDDFIMASPADSLQCSQNLQTSLAVGRSLGLPLHPNKCIGPSTRLIVLGIELNAGSHCPSPSRETDGFTRVDPILADQTVV